MHAHVHVCECEACSNGRLLRLFCVCECACLCTFRSLLGAIRCSVPPVCDVRVGHDVHVGHTWRTWDTHDVWAKVTTKGTHDALRAQHLYAHIHTYHCMHFCAHMRSQGCEGIA
eukprot:1139263-Pelagomonas_calceolata.AAC.5